MSPGIGRDSLPGGTYTLHEYGAMFIAPIRSETHAAAVEAAVHPGDVVVDLGAGVGLYSLLACRAGARRVYAIEMSPLIQLGARFAADNGMADRVVCIEGDSAQVNIPELADVIISDLRGVLPYYHGSVNSIIDARQRFLKPGGRLVPARDTLWAAVVSAPELHASITRPWIDGAPGLDLRRGFDPAVNTWLPISAEHHQMLSNAVAWATLEYQTITGAELSGLARCEVREPADAHGLLVWFDTELVSGIGFSNAPGAPHTVYGRAYFPWPAAVALPVGTMVETTFRVIPGGSEAVWSWKTHIQDHRGKLLAEYQQSTFHGQVFARGDLRKRAHSHVPALSPDGQMVRDVLTWLDGRRALGEVATRLQAKYPEAFRDWSAALARAADISTSVEQGDDGPR